jgi:hypothetical protein
MSTHDVRIQQLESRLSQCIEVALRLGFLPARTEMADLDAWQSLRVEAAETEQPEPVAPEGWQPPAESIAYAVWVAVRVVRFQGIARSTEADSSVGVLLALEALLLQAEEHAALSWGFLCARAGQPLPKPAFSKLGTDARHAPSRRAEERAEAIYISEWKERCDKRQTTKDVAAEEIHKKLEAEGFVHPPGGKRKGEPYSLETVRGWLKGL